MSKENENNLSSPLPVIRLDDTPETANKSSLQKRSIVSTPVSNADIKRRKIYNNTMYQSPLIHLGKTNGRNAPSPNLDDSVIVLDEPSSYQARNNSTVLNGVKELPVFPDDSVIILSDNEGELKTETKNEQRNLHTIIEDDLSEGKRQSPDIKKKTWRVSQRKPRRKLRSNLASALVTGNKMVPSAEFNSNSNPTELQSISIDSEDENIVPNEDPALQNPPQAEIFIVDSSPGVETELNIPRVTISNNQTSPNSAESSKHPGPRVGSRKRLWTVAKQLASLHNSQKKLKHKRTQGFCIDVKGDPSMRQRLNNKKNKAHCAMKNGETSLQNPNWARFVEDKSSPEIPQTAESNLPINVPVTNGRTEPGSYYTEEDTDKTPGSLREIVIDGCNIAMGYTKGRFFSETGLKLVIDYFRLKGHTVKVFIPQHKRCKDHELLEILYKEGTVVFTPSRFIGGKRIVSYDDRFILDYAQMCDGIVVSLDQYRDLYNEKQEWKNVIENRLLVPTFVGRCVMFPDDPLGRGGPKLEEFLRH